MSEWPRNKHGRYACPCCGYFTQITSPPGTHDVCNICGWQEDLTGSLEFDRETHDPDSGKHSCWDMNWWGYANGELTIETARENFEQFGFCEFGTDFQRAHFSEDGKKPEPKLDDLPRYDWLQDRRPFFSNTEEN